MSTIPKGGWQSWRSGKSVRRCGDGIEDARTEGVMAGAADAAQGSLVNPS